MAKAKKTIPKKKVSFRFNLFPVILPLLLFILTILTYEISLSDKYHPFTFVGDTNISFLTEGQAIRKLQAKFRQRTKQKLQFNSIQGSFTIDIATASASLDYSSLDLAFKRRKNQLQTFIFSSKITPKINLSLEKQLDTIDLAVRRPAQNAQLIFDETPTSEGTPSSRIQIKEGTNGLALDKNKTEQIIADFLLTGQYQQTLPFKEVTPKITTNHVTQAKQALEMVTTEPIKLFFESNTWAIDQKQLLTLLDLTKGEGLLLDKQQTLTFIEDIASQIDQKVQEGLFEFNPSTKRVSAFKPSQEGRRVDSDKTFNLISKALVGNFKTITLPVEIIKPKIQTSDVNSLGIKELLSRGISNFAGSIANRIYNINLTAAKINGVLIPPGEIFSFNQTIGDITAQTGFKQAYVIKEGRTVLDDGGGVCQDSTTLFRAVLNAGLPIIKRTAHAYRVGYYEQGFPPGLDATVFYPSVDFQFKNDTSSHILIQAYTAGNTLYVDLYGSSDGREVTLTKPIITNQAPPPTELRQDDPALPKGTVKQVDWAAWGATVSFSRTVRKGGETIAQETWKSNYKPWQAVYLVGTKE
ncbi:VanW family protein [Candidatus Daviesbacteria bacterium]|nr:VanW family protein [Candidatus Daviesbacteria bacterium]MBI4038473.1 VanW family protein [Candidatus Daviesbacteria bacterium]